MEKKILFLDLDDTIFPSNIPYDCFRELFDGLDQVNDSIPKKEMPTVKHALFTRTFGEVAKTYAFSKRMIDAYFDKLENTRWQFNINPYRDYDVIRKLPHQKFLITSGSRSIQQAKINSLGIFTDFIDILFDDPFHGSRGKESLFRDLIQRYNLNKNEILVVGDNPDSEIAAAKRIGLQYVRIYRNLDLGFDPVSRTINSFSHIGHFI